MPTRTAKGTFETKAYSPPHTFLSSIAVTTGDCIVVGFVTNNLTATYDVTWNGTSLTLARSENGSEIRGHLYILPNATGGTGDLVIDTLTGTDPGTVVGWMSTWSELDASPLDQVQSASGTSGTDHDSGNTGTTSQGDEILVALHGVREDDSPSYGTFDTGSDTDTTGQQVNSTGGGGPGGECSCEELYATQTATGARNSDKTAAEDNHWCHLIITLTFTVAADEGLKQPYLERGSFGAIPRRPRHMIPSGPDHAPTLRRVA